MSAGVKRGLNIVLALSALVALGPEARAEAQLDQVQRVLMVIASSDGAARARGAAAAIRVELESRGVEVLEGGDEFTAEGSPSEACIAGACLRRRLEEQHAQLFIGLGVWLNRTQPEMVAILDDGHGAVSVSERFRQGESDAHFATRVLDLLLQAFRGRRGVVLRVTGGPPNSSVVVDHQPHGALPVSMRVQPGPHVISIAHVNYVTQRRTVAVGQAGAEVSIHLLRDEHAASPAEGSASAPGTSGRRRPLVGPLLLGAAGIAAVSWGTWASLRGGCVERDDSGCVAHRHFSSGERASQVVAWVAGGVAVVGAVLWFSLGSSSSSSARRARLGLGPTEAHLILSF